MTLCYSHEKLYIILTNFLSKKKIIIHFQVINRKGIPHRVDNYSLMLRIDSTAQPPPQTSTPLTIHLALIAQDDLPPATRGVDGKGLLEALLDVGAPHPLRVPPVLLVFPREGGGVVLHLPQRLWRSQG